MFKVIEQVEIDDSYLRKEKTEHIKNERSKRLELYDDIGSRLYAFKVDKAHKNGLEIHIITSEGYIEIYNMKSKKLITILSGRPAQIYRYFEQMNLKLDYNVLVAQRRSFKRNRNKNYNNM